MDFRNPVIMGVFVFFVFKVRVRTLVESVG
jgi:hypothetical protein